MPRSRLIWLQIAEQQYHEVPDELRVLVDRRLAQLVENPTADPDADYNAASDRWSVPLGEDGSLFSAVVRDPATVIVLRRRVPRRQDRERQARRGRLVHRAGRQQRLGRRGVHRHRREGVRGRVRSRPRAVHLRVHGSLSPVARQRRPSGATGRGVARSPRTPVRQAGAQPDQGVGSKRFRAGARPRRPLGPDRAPLVRPPPTTTGLDSMVTFETRMAAVPRIRLQPTNAFRSQGVDLRSVTSDGQPEMDVIWCGGLLRGDTV